MPEVTPMMQQYLETKEKHKDCILFYRLGDFYEMFFEDAIVTSKELELTLTGKSCGLEERAPMCGVPYHAAETYLTRLVAKGYKVAICEQVEDPALAKGMVKREVVQLVTPGTAMESERMDAKSNNYLTALVEEEGVYQLAYTDLSTGELKVTILQDKDDVFSELTGLQTREIVVDEDNRIDFEEELIERINVLISPVERQPLPNADQFLDDRIDTKECLQVIESLISYLSKTQMRSLDHIKKAERYYPSNFLKLGQEAKRNLELLTSLKDRSKKGTLVWLLDETKTAMGGRRLKQWIDKPLISKKKITRRQDMVESLLNHYFERNDITELLSKVYDLERLAGRVAFGNVNGRDLIQLKTSLNQTPHLKQIIQDIDQGEWTHFLDSFDPVNEVTELIEHSIQDEPPISITEGDVIKDGFHEELDKYRDAMRNGKQWIAALEKSEREETGIRNLKIGFNKIFGYYIEITKANLPRLDDSRYERKQTLANSERFITPELKEKEKLILEAEEKSEALEHELFQAIRLEVKQYIKRLQALAEIISELDVLQSFAAVSETHHYTRPSFTEESQAINIEGGRHPVVERVMGTHKYVPNDVIMDDETNILLITGPNMSGKSTFMRQLALTVIMGQMGCFIPAKGAVLPIFDQIFTRIGAMDDLISGQSTFMVEMMEANEALKHATNKSLILFDEIGRGTATYDGMALAEAIIEYTHGEVKAKTLFSTHYHELTVLEKRLDALKNVHVGAVEEDGELVFLHKVLPGAADRSYGIHVAKRAGLPEVVIERASEILELLEKKDPVATIGDAIVEEASPEEIISEAGQLALFETEEPKESNPVIEGVISEIEHLSLANITPLDALNRLHKIQAILLEEKIKNKRKRDS